MSTQATALSVLTYTGLAVGFTSGLISLLTKTTIEVEGKKKLTQAGKWALDISILGFSGSFTSELLKAYIKAQDDMQSKLLKEQEAQWKTHVAELQEKIFQNTGNSLKKTEETLGTTIKGFEKDQQDILKTKIDLLGDNLTRETRLYGRLSAANSPLTSLTLKMVFHNVPQRIISTLRNGMAMTDSSTSEAWYQDLDIHHNVDDSDDRNLRESVYYQQAILPFINWLGNGKQETTIDTQEGVAIWKGQDSTERENDALQHQGLLVITLGHRGPALLCIGWIDQPSLFTIDEPETKEGAPTSLLPSGILAGDQINYHLNGRAVDLYNRKYLIPPNVYFDIHQSTVSLTIELDQLSINDALLRYAANGITTAVMPDEVSVFTWRPFQSGPDSEEDPPLQLPFDTQQISTSITGRTGTVTRFSTPIPESQRHFSLQITPNGVGFIGKTYDFTLASDVDIMEGVRGDEHRGYVKIWKAATRQTP